MTRAIDWINSKGCDRKIAIAEAADCLLQLYRRNYPSLIPTELHRLASTLRATIRRTNKLDGGARLVPMPGGFEVLVDSRIAYGRARTAVAHELVHTLFYSADFLPKRLMEFTEAEEHFCFDVGRRILVPLWMLESVGVPRLNDPWAILETLIKGFRVTRPIAARLVLQDYLLASGVAATWRQYPGGWKMEPGKCYASADLDRKQRSILADAARAWLTNQKHSDDFRVTGIQQTSDKATFVMVTRAPSIPKS